jgi:AraC family transcriptional regulator of adaptative response/methylated-DNA-[protein]-cysteine methyltransferase
MKTSDIGLSFDDKLSRSNWAKFKLVDGVPDELWFGTAPTSLGLMTVVGVGDDICYLGFDEGRTIERCLEFFPKADIISNQKKATVMIHKIMDIWNEKSDNMIRVIVNATDFQKDVWNALMKIPNGHAVSYGTIAEYIGRPKAVRAVGSAVGANPVSLFIPCHRVVQKSGKVENYGWGDAMKQKILRAECANQTSKSPASRKSR